MQHSLHEFRPQSKHHSTNLLLTRIAMSKNVAAPATKREREDPNGKSVVGTDVAATAGPTQKAAVAESITIGGKKVINAKTTVRSDAPAASPDADGDDDNKNNKSHASDTKQHASVASSRKTTFPPNCFLRIDTFPPYSPEQVSAFMAWLRTGPNKDVAETNIRMFLYAWKDGDTEAMVHNAKYLEPYAPAKLIGAGFGSLTTHPRFVISRLSGNPARLAGLSDFTSAVSAEIATILLSLQTSDVIQKCRALVVTNCSGVGKTVASLAVSVRLNDSQLHPDYHFYPLYLGFSSNFSLTGVEGHFMREVKTSIASSIACVLLRRLWFQLTALVDATKDGTLQDATADTTQTTFWCPMMPLPESPGDFQRYAVFPSDAESEDVQIECVHMIHTLSERCGGGKKLGLVLIIDEGQIFDQYSEDGARFALRWARCLQLELWRAEARALVIPIMTGIDPATSLSTETDGKNVDVTEAPLTEEEFVAMIRANHPQEQRPDIVAALTYPIARMATEAIQSETMTSYRYVSPFAPLLLLATGANTNAGLPRVFWHISVPARFHADADGLFTPRVPLIALNSYLHKIPWIGTFSVPSTLHDLRKWLDASAFERQAFDVLRLLFALLNMSPDMVGVVENADLHVLNTFTLRVFNATYASCQSELHAFVWLKVGFMGPNSSGHKFPKHENDAYAQKSAYLPSSFYKSHDEAFNICTVGGPAHPLHSGIEALLEGSVFKDTAPGSWCSIWAGGSAPVDFIFIFRPVSDWSQLVLRLAVAKHTSRGDDKSEEGLSAMATKFRLVSDYLKAVLLAKYSASVTDEQFAVVTNCQNVQKSVTVNFADGRAMCIQFMSPTTFNCPPITDLIFGPFGGKQKGY